jgi:hypothetical protein
VKTILKTQGVEKTRARQALREQSHQRHKLYGCGHCEGRTRDFELLPTKPFHTRRDKVRRDWVEEEE